MRIPPPGARAAGAAGALAMVTILGACASAQHDLSAQDLAGCYYFERSPTADSLNLPWGVRLSDQPLEGWPAMAQRQARQAATLTPDGDQDFPFAYWLVAESDSVEIGHPGGGALVVRVALDGQRMAGTVRAAGDALQPGAIVTSRAPRAVALKHALCPEQ